MAFRFSLSSHGWEIVDDEDKPVHAPADGRERDYGIIAKLRNPWARPNQSTFVYLAAGINGLGTWGATDYLASYAPELARHLRATVGRFGADTRFAAVVEVRRRGVSSPHVYFQKAVEQ